MARLWKHKAHGWQLIYTLFFLDNTQKKKYRSIREYNKASAAIEDLERLEYLGSKKRLTDEDVMYFYRSGFINQNVIRFRTVSMYSPYL